MSAKKHEKITADVAKTLYKGAENKEYFNDLVNVMTQ